MAGARIFEVAFRIGARLQGNFASAMNGPAQAMARLQERTRQLSGEQSRLNAAWRQSQQQARAYQSQMASLAGQFQRGGITQARFSAEMARIQQSMQRGCMSASEYRSHMQRLQGELDRTAAATNRLRNAQASQQAAQAASTQARSRMDSAMSNLGTAVSAAAAISAPVVGAIGVAAEYEAAMSKVKAITGSTDEQMAKLDATAKELGATTQFSARQSAEAMSYLGMAGWKTNEIVAGMPGLLALAAAGGTDLARAADIVSDDLTAFGLSADQAAHMSDVFATVITSTNTDVEKMGETMKYAAPVARAFGVSMEETAALTGLMANAGVKASQAGTSLRSGFLRLAGPPKMAREAMAELGVEMSDITKQQQETQAALQGLGVDMEAVANLKGPHKMVAIISQLQEKMKGLSDDQVLAHMKAIFGTEAATGWLNVMKAGPDALNDLTASLENCDGKAEEVAKTMQDNAKGAWVKLQSAIESTAISVGSMFLPELKELGEYLAGQVGGITAWVREHQQLVKTVILGAGAIMGLVVSFFAVQAAAAAFSFVTSQVMAARAAFTLLSVAAGGSVPTVAGALAGIGSRIAVAFRGILGLPGMLLGALRAIPGAVGGILAQVVGHALQFMAFVWRIPSMLGGAVAAIQAVFAGGFVHAVRTAFTAVTAIIMGNPIGLALLALTALIVLVIANWDRFKETASIVWNHVSGTIDAAFARIQAAFGGAMARIAEVWNSITGQSLAGSEVVGAIFNELGFLIGAAFDIAIGIVSTAVSVIINWVASMAQVIGGIINVVAGILTGDWSRAWDGAGQAVDGALGATVGTLKEIASGVGSVIDTLMGKSSEVQAKAESAIALQGRMNAAGAVTPGGSPMDDAAFSAPDYSAIVTQSGQAASNMQQVAANTQQAGNSAEQASSSMQAFGQAAQQIPEQVGAAASGIPAAIQPSLDQIPANMQTTMAQLPPIAQANTDAVTNEMNQLAVKCEPGGQAFVTAAGNWGQQAHASFVQWIDQMAAALNERLGSAWNNLQAQFSAGINVNVTQTVSQVSAVAPHAEGGIFTQPHIGLVAEAGPEAIIPLNSSGAGLRIWQQAGQMLGALPQGSAPSSVPEYNRVSADDDLIVRQAKVAAQARAMQIEPDIAASSSPLQRIVTAEVPDIAMPQMHLTELPHVPEPQSLRMPDIPIPKSEAAGGNPAVTLSPVINVSVSGDGDPGKIRQAVESALQSFRDSFPDMMEQWQHAQGRYSFG